MKSISDDDTHNKLAYMRRYSIGISLNHTLEKDLNHQPSVSIFTARFFFFPFMWPWFLPASSSPIHTPSENNFSDIYPHIYTWNSHPKKNNKKHIITIFNNSPIHISATQNWKENEKEIVRTNARTIRDYMCSKWDEMNVNSFFRISRSWVKYKKSEKRFITQIQFQWVQMEKK